MFVGGSLFDAACWPALRKGHRAAEHPDFSPACLALSIFLSLSCISLFPSTVLPFSQCAWLTLSTCVSLSVYVCLSLCQSMCDSLSVSVSLSVYVSLFFSISLPVSLFSLSVSLSPSQLLILSLLCLYCPSSMLSLYMHRNLRYSRVSVVTQVNEQLSFICSAFNLLKVSKILQGQTSYQILQYSKVITQ